jgi:RND superfamily putative drug exporter
MDNRQLLAAFQTDIGKSKLSPLLANMVVNDRTFIHVTLKHEAASPAAKDWVRHWMKRAGEHHMILGGISKFNQEIFDEIGNKVGYGLGFVLLSTYLILMIAFRSILIPLKAILMNMISLSATFGILVWLFQEGNLGVEPSNITLIIPVLVFGLVFGLSMDYEVFLISRMHEVYIQTKNNDRAIFEGLTSTSKIITAAAAIMIVVTGSFAFTGVVPIKQIGVGIALAIFIDATLVRMILVPSLMKLMGRWNWWYPGRLS